MEIAVGVVGATGMVGEAFMRLLKERRFPVKELRPFASDRSLGKSIELGGKSWPLQTLTEGCFKGLDVVFFSSGDDISKEWGPKAVAEGAFAIDNSAAFRMDPEIPLVVPEINADLIPKRDRPALIANPNCSTIQLVVALKPLLDQFGIEDVRVATYQAVSGAGKPGQEELLQQSQAFLSGDEFDSPQAFAHPIAFNCLPHIGSFNDQGFCSEEVKIMMETRKILGDPQLHVSAFTVRVPAYNGHSEAVWVTLKKNASKEDVMTALRSGEGIELVAQDKPENYPHTLMASGHNPVYVGRVHKDLHNDKIWLMWVVADNVLKGAALNGIQIAERIFDIQHKT